VHLEDPACAGCHKITDPMGLALESFDGAGRFRTEENGAVIDTSGELDGVHFTDVVGLGKALHDNPALPSCLVDRLYSYGSGGAAKPSDRPLLKYYTAEFQKSGYKLPEILRTITLSDAFRHVTEVKKVTSNEWHGPTEEIVIDEQLPTTTTVDASSSSHIQTVALTNSHDKN